EVGPVELVGEGQVYEGHQVVVVVADVGRAGYDGGSGGLGEGVVGAYAAGGGGERGGGRGGGRMRGDGAGGGGRRAGAGGGWGAGHAGRELERADAGAPVGRARGLVVFACV